MWRIYVCDSFLWNWKYPAKFLRRKFSFGQTLEVSLSLSLYSLCLSPLPSSFSNSIRYCLSPLHSNTRKQAHPHTPSHTHTHTHTHIYFFSIACICRLLFFRSHERIFFHKRSVLYSTVTLFINITISASLSQSLSLRVSLFLSLLSSFSFQLNILNALKRISVTKEICRWNNFAQIKSKTIQQ